MIAINNEPNGVNINDKCGAVNVKELSKKVLELKADIGFAFDGDGDRLIVVDEKGNEVDGDKIIALFSTYLLDKKIKNHKFPVIGTVMSNLGLEKYLSSKLKINIKRSSVGDINVIKEMRKFKSCLGGEQSGHIILSKYSKTGDGILAALKVTEIMSISKKRTSQLFNLYESTPQIKINIPYKSLSDKAKKNINNLSKKNNRNKKLRSLIRFSGTEPLIRILVEGDNKKKISEYGKILEKEIRVNLGK